MIFRICTDYIVDKKVISLETFYFGDTYRLVEAWQLNRILRGVDGGWLGAPTAVPVQGLFSEGSAWNGGGGEDIRSSRSGLSVDGLVGI